MSLPLLTDWMPMTVRPVRIGWYQVRYLIRHCGAYSNPVLRYWTGRRWAEDSGDRMRAVVPSAGPALAAPRLQP